MRTPIGIAAMLAALAPLPLFAEQPGKAADREVIQAEAGDFKIIHLWSTQPDAFLKAWSGPTPPQLPSSGRMKRNQVIQQFILFANCTRDNAGHCHLAARMEITAPDGSRYGEVLEFDALDGPAPATPNVIGLTSAGIALVIEDGEQLGRYRVRLTVTDTNADLTVTTLRFLEAVETGD